MNAVAYYRSKIKDYDLAIYQHCNRVAVVSFYIGQSLNLSKDELSILYSSAILHDLGKIKIPRDILYKTEPLSKDEFAIIKKHPQVSSIILNEQKSLPQEITDSIKTHHEFYDGTGYNAGLKGENIPHNARIIAIADAFDAMVTSRPYREERLTIQEAVKELLNFAGEQFDPYIISKIVASKVTLRKLEGGGNI